MVAQKLVDDQRIDSPWTLANLSDNNITKICDVIRKPGGLVGRRTPNRGNQIFILMVKNFKPAVFKFKSVEHYSKTYCIRCVNSRAVLEYQYQWRLGQKKKKDLKVPNVDNNNWAKTMENIILYLKLIRGLRGVSLAYVVWHHVKVAHILPGYSAYLNVDEEMIARAPIIDSMSNLKLTQEYLDRVYLSYQCNKFKIDNTLVYQILSTDFMDMDAYA